MYSEFNVNFSNKRIKCIYIIMLYRLEKNATFDKSGTKNRTIIFTIISAYNI